MTANFVTNVVVLVMLDYYHADAYA